MFCDPVKEKYNSVEILEKIKDRLYKLKLPVVDEVLPEDCFHVPVNPDAAIGFIPECFFGKGFKQKDVDAMTRFPAFCMLKSARDGLRSDRTIWTVGGRSRAQKVSWGEPLRSRFLIVPDAISKIACLAGTDDLYRKLVSINKNYSGNEILTGIDFMNGNYTSFHSRLNEFEYCLEADMKRFDQHVGREILKVAFSILRCCYPEGIEMDNLNCFYASGFINKNIVILGGLLYRVRKSIATGSPFTSIIGSIVNWINWTLVLIDSGIGKKFYKLMVYGDDTLICFRNPWLFGIKDISDLLFKLTGQTADPLVFKNIKGNYWTESLPTFLKTFSFYGLPGRYFNDFFEKAFYPEFNFKNLFEKSVRTKQLFFNPCFNPDSLFNLWEFLKFVYRQMYRPGKYVKGKGYRKQMLSFYEFYYQNDSYFSRIISTSFKKYSEPNDLRHSWSNFNFEKYKDKLIPSTIFMGVNFDDPNFNSYYGINFRDDLCKFLTDKHKFCYSDLVY